MAASCGESARITGHLAQRIATARKRCRPRACHSRRFCPHCKQSLSLKTFKKHQKLFLKSDGAWMSTKDAESDSNCETEGRYM